MNSKENAELISEKKETLEELDYSLLTDPKKKTYGKAVKREILNTTQTLLAQKKIDPTTVAVIKNLPIETLLMLKLENTVDTFYDYSLLNKFELDKVLATTIKDTFWRTTFSDCGSQEKFNMLLREPVYSEYEDRQMKMGRRKVRRFAGLDRLKNLKGTKTLFPEDKTFTGHSFADYLKEVEFSVRNRKSTENVLFGQLEKDEKLKVYKALTFEEITDPELYLTPRLTAGADRVRVQERESKERIRNRRRVQKEIREKHLEHKKQEYREKYGQYEELSNISETTKSL